jgi:hypothetical protein
MWKDIEFAKGSYQVSSEGKVRSLSRYVQYKNHKQRMQGRELLPQLNSKGYFRVKVIDRLHFIHRLVAQEFIPNPNNLPIVNHKDGNKLNNNSSNLEWVTNAENLQHAYREGFAVSVKGEDKHSNKLTEIEVIWILNNYEKGSSEFGRKPLARKFGVSHQTIKNIIDRKKWKHIQL